MILDERSEFADAVSVAAVAGTALIGDVIDTRIAGTSAQPNDVGLSSDLWLVIQTDTEIITGGSAGTIRFQLASDAQAAIATDGSASVHFDTGTLVTDDAAANDSKLNAGGLIACVKVPRGVYERYLGILCIIGATTVTAGKINAFLTNDVSAWAAYADAVN
jgi:hypothetical protein